LLEGTVTICIGITELSSQGDTAEEAINRADQALYESKHQGKNRVTIR
jgi:diguanylate cyclase